MISETLSGRGIRRQYDVTFLQIGDAFRVESPFMRNDILVIECVQESGVGYIAKLLGQGGLRYAIAPMSYYPVKLLSDEEKAPLVAAALEHS